MSEMWELRMEEFKRTNHQLYWMVRDLVTEIERLDSENKRLSRLLDDCVTELAQYQPLSSPVTYHALGALSLKGATHER